jgi:hypothetical protein
VEIISMSSGAWLLTAVTTWLISRVSFWRKLSRHFEDFRFGFDYPKMIVNWSKNYEKKFNCECKQT